MRVMQRIRKGIRYMKANFLELLEETARRLPEKTAFYDDREGLSFRRLEELAQRIGSRLAEATGPRKPIALLMDARSIRNIPAMYGTLYAGCAYAPLDITMPPERLTLLLDLMQPSAVLADEKGIQAFESCGHADVPLIAYEDAAAAAVDTEKLQAIRKQACIYDPMSVLYTSGSTGIPKGSVQTHFSYLHWTEATIEVYGLTENVVFGNQSPFFYANSVLEVITPVALGSTVYLLPSGALTFPKKMIENLREHHVSLLCMTPSSFISIVNGNVLTRGCLPELKWGIMSGESMPWEPLKVWMDATPGADWWHFYGSTEMFSVAVGKVDPDHKSGDRLPVGKPFSLVHILFLDENGEEAVPGEPGEMYVSSPWVAVTYYRDPERTMASWVTDPLEAGWSERFFRGGDLGYLREDGQLMVLGRRDNQIKHMGYRMEIGEVDAALRKLPGIQEECVLFDSEKDMLWCFYTGGTEEKEIRAGLKEQLVRYMIPDRFVQLTEMPHTASMKLDRLALKNMMEGA